MRTCSDMSPFDRPPKIQSASPPPQTPNIPFLQQIPQHPPTNLAPQPPHILTRIIPPRLLAYPHQHPIPPATQSTNRPHPSHPTRPPPRPARPPCANRPGTCCPGLFPRAHPAPDPPRPGVRWEPRGCRLRSFRGWARICFGGRSARRRRVCGGSRWRGWGRWW
jgi:hypothetical protein